MKKEKLKRLDYIKSKGFNIDDEKFTLEYIDKVGIYKLSRYFINFRDIKNPNFSEVINHYLFDIELRNLNLGLLEHIENSLKAQFIIYIGEEYNNPDIYVKKYRKERIDFNNEKIELFRKFDNDIKKLNGKKIPCGLFVEKLTFGEIYKIFKNLEFEYKFNISFFYGIKNINIFESWIFSLKYLRNLCSHGENIFNRQMTETPKGNRIEKKFGLNANNVYISYFSILSIFNKILNINNVYEKKVFKKMIKYNIDVGLFGIKKKPSVFGLESEAWKVLVNSLYSFYIKKSKENFKFT